MSREFAQSELAANWIALKTIVHREVRRFLRIWPQTLLPPAITMVLYFVIFGNLVGRQIGDMGGFSYMDYIVPGLIIGVANGIGAGILMTLGADLADPAHPGPFLGAWRFTGDAGAAVAPVLIAAVTAAASLPVAAAVMGALGLVGAVNLRVYVPRYAAPRRERGVR